MIFPDHVTFRCYVSDDARADAAIAFDGKHRRELKRGEQVQIKMCAYPGEVIVILIFGNVCVYRRLNVCIIISLLHRVLILLTFLIRLVPTINKIDHSSDWLTSLKKNFNFNARPRQEPI